MKLNARTIGLIVILLVGIAAVVLIGGQQTETAAVTPTPDPQSGRVFADGVAGADISRIALRESLSGLSVTLTRESGSWSISDSLFAGSGALDGLLIDSVAGQIAEIAYTTAFESDDLAAFGLEAPTQALALTIAGEPYTLLIGGRAPTSPRYYAVLTTGTLPEVTPEATPDADATPEATPDADATPEATPDADATPEVTPELLTLPPIAPIPTLTGTQRVLVIPQTAIDTVGGWLFSPPFLPPTPEPDDSIGLPTPEPTP